MVKFTGKKNERKCVVFSKTPPKKGPFRFSNREHRRAVVHAFPVRRLFHKTLRLRAAMIDAGIEPGPLPLFKNRKALSGHMSQLVTKIRA